MQRNEAPGELSWFAGSSIPETLKKAQTNATVPMPYSLGLLV